MSVYVTFGIYGRDLDFAGKPVSEARTLWRDRMEEFDSILHRRPNLSQNDFFFIVIRDHNKQYIINDEFVLQDGDECHLLRKWPQSAPSPLTLEDRIRRWFTIKANRLRLMGVIK